jgi:hypothetical protein
MVKERFDLQDNKLSMTIFINSNNSHYAWHILQLINIKEPRSSKV